MEMQTSWTARMFGLLEEMPWLDGVGDAVSSAVQPLLDRAGDGRVKEALHGRWFGHSLHPVLSDVPIGFWTSAFVLDLVGARFSSRLMNLAGCLSAAGTVATGFADWSVTDGRERRLGVLHGLLNTAGLACQVVALTSPRRYRRWSWTGYAISSAAAYLGGELVFGRGLTVDHDAWIAGPADWTPVAADGDLHEGAAWPVRLDGRTILLSREDGRVSAIEDACSHAGGPLHEGSRENGVVTCPWHGSRFRLDDGRCVGGPATFPQLRLEARVRDGRVEVRGRPG